jgi:hypothetical protein
VNIVLLILVAIVLALNVRATWVLAHSSCYGKRQKLIQYALVWLVPVLGAMLIWSLAADFSVERITTDLSDRFGNDDGNIRLENYSSEGGVDGGGD